MKEDAPAPERVPTKRAQLAAAPPLWLRQWSERTDLHPNEVKRVQKEIERRKEAEKQPTVKLAIITGNEGLTPKQLREVPKLIRRIQPTELRLIGQTKKVMPLIDHRMVRVQAFPETIVTRNVIRDSTVAIMFPKEGTKPNQVDGVWDAVRFAKHRNIQTRVIMPDGSLHEE